ncbi:MAG: NAD(P)-binding protein [Nanoarchaeota archaeon]|nr:NAD(P)-binding protein [Nanoarchaeota archaeon]
MKKRVLILGCGISGASLARLFKDAGHYVEIREKGKEVGGMLRDGWDKEGKCYVSWDGPHIINFSKETKKAENFLLKNTTLVPFKHKVLCLGNNSSFTYWPINLTYKSLFEFMFPKKSIFDEFVASYSKKMWKKHAKDQIERIKDRFKPKDNYNQDFFQGRNQYQPVRGYSNMVRDLIRGCHLVLNKSESLKSLKKEFDKWDYIIVTSHIDTFFGYKFGKLQFKGLDFEFKKIRSDENVLPTCVVNLNQHPKYIRVSEINQLQAKENKSKTRVLCFDYPSDKNRFYPVENENNLMKIQKYKDYSLNFPKITFCGRTANYKYKDIDDSIMDSIALFQNLTRKHKLKEFK